MRAAFLAAAALFAWSSQASASRVAINPKTLQPIIITPETFANNRAAYQNAGVSAGYEIVKYSPKANFVNALRQGGSAVIGSKAFQVVKGGGRLIGAGALLQVGAVAVNEALKWFYNELKRETGTALDQYVGKLTWYIDISYPECRTTKETKFNPSTGQDYTVIHVFTDTRVFYSYNFNNYTNYETFTMEHTPTGTTGCTQSMMSAGVDDAKVRSRNRGTAPNTATWQPYAGTPGKYLRNERINTTNYTPYVFLADPGADIASIIDSNPAAMDALRKMVEDYMRAHPPTAADWENNRPWGGNTTSSRTGGPVTINEITGGPWDRDLDTDRDGFTDGQELDGHSDMDDPDMLPGDLDNDGIPDYEDPDMDGDGVPDDVENDKGTDPYDPESKPEEPEEPEPIKCPSGYEASSDGKSCTPVKDDPKCPDGYRSVEGSDPPKCEKIPDDDPKDPPSDTCGDFSVPRLLAHTGHYIRDVFFPCESLQDLFAPLLAAARTKYPFSLVSAINGNLIQAPDSGDQSAVLPATWGPFTFDWSWLSPLLLVVGLLFKGFASWLAVDLVLSRMWGQVVIK